MPIERYPGLLWINGANLENFMCENFEAKQPRPTKLGYETFLNPFELKLIDFDYDG